MARSASPAAAERMYRLVEELYPLCRSITGEGTRATLRRLAADLPLTMYEVPSGTPVYDWVVPREWNIHDAYVKDAQGRRVIDFQQHSLQVMSYSAPVHRRMSLAELQPYLHTLPEQPELIPYRTSYYKEAWGFCLSQHALEGLAEGEYEVVIDSSFDEQGSLTYGELFLPGATDDEVLFSCHVCHPSLANDNLSGIAVALEVARTLSASKTRYSYRFVFAPGTIGTITWLARNEALLPRIKAGLVLSCVGDPAPFTYKRSRAGNSLIDRAFTHLVAQGQRGQVIDFFPYGYDERQYNSPGINLPMGCLMRSVHGQFAEYHTSADNLQFVRPEALNGTLELVLAAIRVFEQEQTYINTNPKCEPQLGKRGLYGSIGGLDLQSSQLALLWVLNLSDGHHSLLDIAERAALPFDVIATAASRLHETGLLTTEAC